MTPSAPIVQSEPRRSPAATTRRGARVAAVVTGQGLVAQAALHALRASGPHNFLVAYQATEQAGRPDPDGLSETPDEQAAEHDAPRWYDQAGVATREYPSPDTAEWTGSWLADCDLCLLCADVVDAEVALAVNARCLEYRVPLLPALVMGSVGQAGPMIEPGVSACLQCVDQRLQAATGRSCLADYGPADHRVASLVGTALAVRALRLLAGVCEPQDRRLTYHWAAGYSTDHAVLRSLQCTHCAEAGAVPAFCAPAQLDLSEQPPDARRILTLQRELVDAVTGPIRSLERFEPRPEEPRMRHWVAGLADIGWARVGHPILRCGGNNLDDEMARAAAIGEALERMSACQPATGLVMASYRATAPHSVDPSAWDLFDPQTRAQPGFPYAPVTPDDVLSWTWGWSLTRSHPALVPASRVFMPFHPQTPADHADYPTLSGFATGSTLASATVAAVLETLERDALMIAWTNRLSPPHLELDRSSPGGVGACVAAFADSGVEIRCSLLTLDHRTPVVLAMARGAGGSDPAMVVSAAAGLDAASACRRALCELAANRLNVKAAMVGRELRQSRPDQVTAGDGAGNGLLYADPQMAAHLGCWWDDHETVALPDTTGLVGTGVGLDALVARIAAAGLETIIVDLTPPAIRELGLFVVKALVPGTYPLSFDSHHPHLDGSRLRSAAVASGLLATPVSFDALNRMPVPFG